MNISIKVHMSSLFISSSQFTSNCVVSPRQVTSKSGQALNGNSREGTPIPNFGSEAQSVTMQRGQKIATNQGNPPAISKLI